jgi:hypothetical protein
MDNKDIWIKYKIDSSAGSGEWEYTFLKEENIESCLDIVAERYNWSEHYRGIEYKKVNPPLFIIEKKIEDEENHFKYAKNRYEENMAFLKQQLKIKHPKVKPVCSKCGYKSYCQNKNLNKNIKKNSIECIKEFIKYEKK